MKVYVYDWDSAKLYSSEDPKGVEQAAYSADTAEMTYFGESHRTFYDTGGRTLSLTLDGDATHFQPSPVPALLIITGYGSGYERIEGAIYRVSSDGAWEFRGVRPVSKELLQLERFEARVAAMERTLEQIRKSLGAAFGVSDCDDDTDDYDYD